MKFLLDEMHGPRAAAELRGRGYDVVAVKERPDLCGLPDDELLAAAVKEGRVVVTENVKDFAELDRQWAAAGRDHRGLVFTHPRRFPRSSPSHVRRLADALARLDENEDELRSTGPFVWWLDS